MEVKFYGTIRQIVGRETLKLRLKRGTTIQGALERLFNLHGVDLERKLSKNENWVIMLNNRNVVFLDGEGTILNDGDHLAILSPLTGG